MLGSFFFETFKFITQTDKSLSETITRTSLGTELVTLSMANFSHDLSETITRTLIIYLQVIIFPLGNKQAEFPG